MSEAPILSPEQKEALTVLFKAAFEMGYRQGQKRAAPADNNACIRATLRVVVETLTNPTEDTRSR
jgi:hypothetical protein